MQRDGYGPKGWNGSKKLHNYPSGSLSYSALSPVITNQNAYLNSTLINTLYFSFGGAHALGRGRALRSQGQLGLALSTAIPHPLFFKR
jgi:hypothetical protein